MKKLNPIEQKKELIEMLKYFHEICIKNEIKYTLLGGSLIGAIRHKGFIPWDDDIDIGLLPEDYEKLLKVFSKEKNDRYKLFFNMKDYYYPFPKLVDTNTILEESNLRKIPNYGLFIDIFVYHYVPNNKILRKLHFLRMKFRKTFINGYFYEHINRNSNHYLLRKIRQKISVKIGIEKILKYYNSLCNIESKKTNYVMTNWPAYSVDKETQNVSWFDDYIITKFDGTDTMIVKKYDLFLKNVFGDYMKIPPEEKRVSHNLTVYKK